MWQRNPKADRNRILKSKQDIKERENFIRNKENTAELLGMKKKSSTTENGDIFPS